MTPDRKAWIEQRASTLQRDAAIGYARAEMFMSLRQLLMVERSQRAAQEASEQAADLLHRLIHGED